MDFFTRKLPATIWTYWSPPSAAGEPVTPQPPPVKSEISLQKTYDIDFEWEHRPHPLAECLVPNAWRRLVSKL